MSQIYKVVINHQGKTHTVEVPEDQSILEAANNAGVDLPFSCSAGVCTTCAAQITEGEVEQGDGMGLSPDLQVEGYALLCVSYPRSDLKLDSNKEEIVYDRQFGKPD